MRATGLMREDPQTCLLAPILTGCPDNLSVRGLLVHKELKTSLMNQLRLYLTSAKCHSYASGGPKEARPVSQEGGGAGVLSSCRKPGQDLLQIYLCLGVSQPWVWLCSHHLASTQETFIDTIGYKPSLTILHLQAHLM